MKPSPGMHCMPGVNRIQMRSRAGSPRVELSPQVTERVQQAVR